MALENGRRVILITGATSGLGRATAEALADSRYELILSYRDKARGEKLAEELSGRHPDAKVSVYYLDLASLASIRAFADEITRHYERIDVLLNNAGLYKDQPCKTVDGFEMTVGVNTLGPYVLTLLLLPLLQKGRQSQIIQMSSIAALLGNYRDRPGVLENQPYGFRAYLNSKTMQLMMTLHLAEKLKREGITVNAVHPGIVSTGLWKGRSILMKLLSFRHKKRYLSSEEAAKAVLFLIEDERARRMTGKLFKAGGKEIRLGRRYRNRRWIGSLIARTQEAVAVRTLTLFAGTCTDPAVPEPGIDSRESGKGIYAYHLDHDTGRLNFLTLTEGIPNPSFLTLSPSGRFLYAVSELSTRNGCFAGFVSAFTADLEKGRLVLMNSRETKGANPCHVTVNQDETHLFVTNYTSGSICVFPIRSDGSLGDMAQFIQHEGRGVDLTRQEAPHPHSLTLSPDSRFAYVADLGLDRIMAYRFDAGARMPLTPALSPFVTCKPGSGPRHCDMDLSGRFLYCVHELDSTISVYSYEQETGYLKPRQTVSMLPDGFMTPNTGADIHVSPDGCFLYASNRGHDSIAIYKINWQDGRLTLVGHENSGGCTPRNFAIDPTGRFLLAANQDTGSLVTFRIDCRTGRLAKIAQCAVPAPYCVKTTSFWLSKSQK